MCSIRTSSPGVTVACAWPPFSSCHEYLRSSPMGVKSSSDACELPSSILISEVVVLESADCSMRKVSVPRRWPCLKMPKEPASTVCEPPLLGRSGFFEAQEKDDANTNSASNDRCTTVFFTIPPTECLPFLALVPLPSQSAQSACPRSRHENWPGSSAACVPHRACGTRFRSADYAARARAVLSGNGATALPRAHPEKRPLRQPRESCARFLRAHRRRLPAPQYAAGKREPARAALPGPGFQASETPLHPNF